MENEEHVISIGEIFRVIFKRVWWVIGVTAAFLLIFVFVVQFWYNKNNQTYTVGYEIYFPGMNDGYYPDGAQYRLDNVTSVETLTEIRESNKEFDGINVEEMVEKDEISINKVAVTAEDSATGVAQSYITLTVSAKYFKDNDQAAAFIRAVAAYPVTHALEIVETLKHDDSLVIYDASYTDTFDKKINLLTEQRSYILSMYDSMISTVTTNGSSYMVNGKTLAQYRAEAAAIFDGDDQNDVNYQLDINHYVLDYETFRNSVDVKIKSLEKTIQNNNNIITAAKEERKALIKVLQDSGQTSITVEIAPFNNIIAEYTETNAKLTNQINELKETQGWLKGKEDAQIQADINSFLAVLDGLGERPGAVGVEVDAGVGELLLEGADGLELLGAGEDAALELPVLEAVALVRGLGELDDGLYGFACRPGALQGHVDQRAVVHDACGVGKLLRASPGGFRYDELVLVHVAHGLVCDGRLGDAAERALGVPFAYAQHASGAECAGGGEVELTVERMGVGGIGDHA